MKRASLSRLGFLKRMAASMKLKGFEVLSAGDGEAAASIMNSDPAVKAEVFTARISPFHLALTGRPS